MKSIKLFLGVAIMAVLLQVLPAQSTTERTPDVSNKALITTATPDIKTKPGSEAAALHKLADDYYAWRNEQYPVRSSDAGLHTWDDRLTDYSAAKISERAQHIRALLDKVRAMETAKWPKRRADRLDAFPFATRKRCV